MSEWRSKGGDGSAYFVDGCAGLPVASKVLFPDGQAQGGTTFFASVSKDDYIVRTKIVVSDVLISCFKIAGGEPEIHWSVPTKCYGGVQIAENYVVAGDGVYRLQDGEMLISLPKEKVDIRTKSVLYENVFLYKTGAGQGCSIEIISKKEAKIDCGPLAVVDQREGFVLGVDVNSRQLVATSMIASKIAWSVELDVFLENSGWNLSQRIVPMCIRNQSVYLVIGAWLIVLNLNTGEIVRKFEYFESCVQASLLKSYTGLSMGNHLHVNQIATNGKEICLINYGHPGWILMLDADMKEQWILITTDQYAGVIFGNSIFTTSEGFHRAYDVKSGIEIWKSDSKSSCTNIFTLGEKGVCFESPSGLVELYELA